MFDNPIDITTEISYVSMVNMQFAILYYYTARVFNILLSSQIQQLFCISSGESMSL